jgi:hypothetical protein
MSCESGPGVIVTRAGPVEVGPSPSDWRADHAGTANTPSATSTENTSRRQTGNMLAFIVNEVASGTDFETVG